MPTQNIENMMKTVKYYELIKLIKVFIRINKISYLSMSSHWHLECETPFVFYPLLQREHLNGRFSKSTLENGVSIVFES